VIHPGLRVDPNLAAGDWCGRSLGLGRTSCGGVGVALWVGVAVTTGATALDFPTRLCGVADAAGLGVGVSV
jgi:hypothetical protein